jgi:moderate conductance mechanosensitive channel
MLTRFPDLRIVMTPRFDAMSVAQPPEEGEAAAAARDTFTGLFAQVESFIRGALELDPEQAAIRAGLTLLVIVGAALTLTVLRIVVKAIVQRVAPEKSEKKQRFKLGGWTKGIVRLLIAVGALLIILQVWGVDLATLLDGPFGGVLLIGARIALTIVVILVTIEVSQLAIRRTLTRIADKARSPRRAAQLRTLAPVISGVITTSLVVIGAMTVLSNIGIDIGPLLAGAGIVGLAVGFGAQTIVKDFLTGMFLIIEDTVSIGDVARIGDASGLVEDMSLRTIKLRAFDGTLQVIPYGEAQVIHNMTKDFSFYVFDLSISYSSNIAKALELMKRIGDELQGDEEYSSFIMEPIEIIGVDRLADSGVILRARIKTRPIKQWVVGREYLKRIKLAFDANGIEIPFPHLKLVPPDQPIPFSAIESANAQR